MKGGGGGLWREGVGEGGGREGGAKGEGVHIIMLSHLLIFPCRRLWITCVGFAVVGVAAAFSLIPPFADMLGIAK